MDEPAQEPKKSKLDTHSSKFRLLYSGEVDAMIKHIKPKHGQGITRFDNRQLDQAADWLANNVNADRFSVDFEPGAAKEAWHWDMADPNFRKTMYQLSEKIYQRHGKLFYSWIGEPLTFDFQGKNFQQINYANDGWSANKKKKTLIIYVSMKLPKTSKISKHLLRV
ncbi:MAG: hypothetical protein R2822_28545 [Spirosomataceae bacterium]